MATLALRALGVEEIPLQGPARADTATILVWGEYEQPEDGAIEITYGHAKENNRQHSKQFQLGAVSVGQGMPLLGQVLDGNSSDKTWTFETLETLSRQLDADDIARLVYIGDSQMVTGPNLDRMAELHWQFISRLPSVYSLADEVKAAAFAQGQWLEVGRISPGKGTASYKLQEHSGVIDDRTYRLVVVRCCAPSTRSERSSRTRLQPGSRNRSRSYQIMKTCDTAPPTKWLTAPHSCSRRPTQA